MAGLLGDESGSSVVVHAGRMASDENSHIILIKRKLGLDKNRGLFTQDDSEEEKEEEGTSSMAAETSEGEGGFLRGSPKDSVAPSSFALEKSTVGRNVLQLSSDEEPDDRQPEVERNLANTAEEKSSLNEQKEVVDRLLVSDDSSRGSPITAKEIFEEGAEKRLEQPRHEHHAPVDLTVESLPQGDDASHGDNDEITMAAGSDVVKSPVVTSTSAEDFRGSKGMMKKEFVFSLLNDIINVASGVMEKTGFF